ncbi:MAG: hypothetical protein Q8O30_10025 [Candidatus Omnitrophota bacterium]|nr:hypothetical protein [Candidatus Omnitrophota bacterium]
MRRAVLLFCVYFLAFSYVTAEEETIGINEGEFAASFTAVLGINKELSDAAKGEDYITILEHYGIAPIDGWSVSRPLTLGRFAAILVRAKNIKHEIINDTEVCFNNVNNINREWFLRFKKEKRWASLKEALGSKKCPFGINYEEENKQHLIERHPHPNIEKIEEAYIELLKKNNVSLPPLQVSQIVSRAQTKEVIRSFSGEVSSLQPYLTPATPILPKDLAVVKMLKGYLVFAVYENGSASGRKVNWKPTWTEGSTIEVTVSYANDASLPGNKSIAMFINGIEVSSSVGKWTQELTPDEYICIGAQSDLGKYPADAILFDFKISPKTKLEEILMDEKSLTLFSKLDSLAEITSPKFGLGGKLSPAITSKQDVFKNNGFFAQSENQYILFPIENMNHFKGSFSLKIAPNFISSKEERAFLSTVQWNAKGGVDGFYLYYQPEEQRR